MATQASQVLLLTSALMLTCWSGLSKAFGNGSAIPSIACRTMLPFHEAWSQVNDQGCTLAFNGSVALGKYQKLTLSCGGKPFKGFLVQCRTVDEDNDALGRFSKESNTQLVMKNCHNGKDNCVSHKNVDPKTSVELRWTPGKSACEDVIRCRATVVFSTKNFTTHVRAAPARCASTANSDQSPSGCAANEEYRGCACDPTCDGSPTACQESCRPGCFCKTGFFRRGERCVSNSQCPVPTPEVAKTNPQANYGTVITFHVPAVKPGYSRQLVEIGQQGSAVTVAVRLSSEDVENGYVTVTPGYHTYGFQYVRDSDGRESPIGATFSVGTPPAQQTPVPTPEVAKTNPQANYGTVITFHVPAVKPGYSRQL
eukprot:scpid93142/ scgid15963/ Putative ferric-chelate reductase 1 homolog